MTVCKRAHRNLKLQLYLVWPTAKKFECIMIFKDDEWPGRKMTISEEIGILNCLLPTMVTEGMCRLVNISVFQKSIILEKRVL